MSHSIQKLSLALILLATAGFSNAARADIVGMTYLLNQTGTFPLSATCASLEENFRTDTIDDTSVTDVSYMMLSMSCQLDPQNHNQLLLSTQIIMEPQGEEELEGFQNLMQKWEGRMVAGVTMHFEKMDAIREQLQITSGYLDPKTQSLKPLYIGSTEGKVTFPTLHAAIDSLYSEQAIFTDVHGDMDGYMHSVMTSSEFSKFESMISQANRVTSIHKYSYETTPGKWIDEVGGGFKNVRDCQNLSGGYCK